MLFNEEATEVKSVIRLKAEVKRQWINPFSLEARVGTEDEVINFKPHELKILRVINVK
jgi:hypothetical protein